MTLAGIFIGGGLGAMLRFWLGNVITAKTKGLSLPISILTVNILGALGLGIFTGLHVANASVSLIIGTGFFGAFTTFSTFSVESIQLLMAKRVIESILYIALTLCGSLLTFWCGWTITM
ncbi:fluoride efflux transporter CrcB [Bacillus subtilis]|uniref:fluoride efflux transporter CrcB n=1 Tax=Bacillus subtilis TaxID=1423 RepID=UPI0009889568|nr:fluoride efflux transporter CrcB [Bacillus subtilis]OOE21210.1 camphor resistance protein CrcB [Bacillus subtilis]PAE58716.1 fluoride efflux transporter CrcB [Bacillus subtilis]WJF87748.1 fluoride efflux transporter CrcB [Bacillus subtilis]